MLHIFLRGNFVWIMDIKKTEFVHIQLNSMQINKFHDTIFSSKKEIVQSKNNEIACYI